MTHFITGFKKAIGLGISFIPFGFTLGVIAKGVGSSNLDIILMTALVYAGNSQIIILQLFYTMHSSIIQVILAASIVNIRYSLISLPIFRMQKKDSKLLKFVNSLFMTDETVSFMSIKNITNIYEALGVNICGYLFFNLSTIIGVYFSKLIPQYHISSLGFTIFAVFITLLVTAIMNYPKFLILFFLSIIIKFLLVYFTNLQSAFILLITVIFASLIFVIIDNKLECE